jgi:hypothetical protein
MIRIRRHIQISSLIILFVSTIFAIVIGSGLYGYGSDYYAAYHIHNIGWGGIFDRLGYILSTLSINNVHIGVHIVTFLLSLSSGYLIREHLKFKKSYSLILFIFIYLIAIHTWPIIMSTSNAMRQGLAMSFIFMGLVAASRKSYFWALLFCFMSIFMHRTGLILFAIILFSHFINYFLERFLIKRRALINLLFGMLVLFFSYHFLSIVTLGGAAESSRIIRGDFRAAFILIGFTYVALSFFYKSILSNPFNLTLYYFGFIALAFLLNDLNWQYERLGMMMLIPYILSFGLILNRNSYKIYIISIFVALLFLTFFMGMYASLR